MSDTEVQRPETSASTLLASNDGNGLRAVIGQTERETTERETAETTERETEHAAARTLQSLCQLRTLQSLSTAACVNCSVRIVNSFMMLQLGLLQRACSTIWAR